MNKPLTLELVEDTQPEVIEVLPVGIRLDSEITEKGNVVFVPLSVWQNKSLYLKVA